MNNAVVTCSAGHQHPALLNPGQPLIVERVGTCYVVPIWRKRP